MAVEWNDVDVARFERSPRVDESLRVVVEAKKMDNSCLSAVSQAMSYAQPRPQCRRLIVTDGLRYGVYVRTDTEPLFKLHAYLNLARLRHDYPAHECGGPRMPSLRWLLSGSPMSEISNGFNESSEYRDCVGSSPDVTVVPWLVQVFGALETPVTFRRLRPVDAPFPQCYNSCQNDGLTRERRSTP